MKYFKKAIKFIAIGFVVLVLILALFPFGKGSSLKKANADSIDAYPGVCLGGWESPGDAAGTPDVSPGGTSFTDQNSAVLNGEQAQIFCGSFQASDQSQTPVAVTLHFSWDVVFASQAPAASVSTDTDSSAWTNVLDATSTATTTTNTATSTSDQSSATPSSTPAAATSSTDGSGAAPSAPAPSSTPVPVPAAAPDQSDASQSSTSFLEGIMKDPFTLLVQKTFAQTATDTAPATVDTSTATGGASVDTSDNFMDVSYSLDGTTWTDLGQVNASDWQNYTATIPISSWSDINKLQIQLSPDISPNEPIIYLDGMWLEADYNQSLLGALQDGANAAINAITGLSSAVDNALSDLLPSDASSTASSSPQDASDTALNIPLPPAPVPAPPVHQYVFQTSGILSIDTHDLSWISAGDQQEYESGIAAQSNVLPTVTLPDQNTIQVTGSCSEAYYTILIFANESDYANNPSAAVLNEADPCVGGSFSKIVLDTDLPPQLTAGTYYLMVANQGKKGPWQPYPILYPIVLGNVSSG